MRQRELGVRHIEFVSPRRRREGVRRRVPHERDVSSAAITGTATGATGNPKVIQWVRPPSSGRTRVTPRRLSRSATRALVASLGQEQ